jgi:membrane associated rhomboid family serine protease
MDKRRITPLLVFCYFGLSGVLLDLDHLVSLLSTGSISRAAHLSGLFVSWLAWFVVSAYCVGLLYLDLLKRITIRLTSQELAPSAPQL